MQDSATTVASAVQQEAEDAVSLATAQPREARARALAARERAREVGDRAAESTAERALGLAARELGDLDGALAHLQAAISVAERAGAQTEAGRARMSLSLVLANRGDTVGALRAAELAARDLSGLDAARLHVQRALVLQRLGRHQEALLGYRMALPVLRRHGDRLWEARLLSNRGVLHTYRGAFAAAEADLRAAERLLVALGQDLLTAQVRHNLGFVAAARGDVPAALAWFDRADAYFREHGLAGAHAIALLDRSDALASVRLVAEAKEAAQEAVAVLEAAGMASDLAEARLALAQAALLDGDHETARAQAEQARRAFSRQRRQGWAALARWVAVQASWVAGERSDKLLAAARRAAETLTAAGWEVAALDARLIAARTALDLGRQRIARAELERAAPARRRGPVQLRTAAWYAEALLALAEGDRAAADAALHRGVTVLEDYRATLGATDLRTAASAHTDDLAVLGLRLALEDGRPARVLEWAERCRAAALLLRPARPPGDAELADDLAELRHVVARIKEATTSGGDVEPLLRRQRELEDAVRRRAHHARGDDVAAMRAGLGPRRQVRPPTVDALRAALGERALIDVCAVDGTLWAVVVTPWHLALRRLGPLDEVTREIANVRFALRRLAVGHGSAVSRQVAVEVVGYAAARLEELLLRPVRDLVDHRALVVVPPAVLHALPWGLLPSCRRRPVAVAPSASVWLRAATTPSSPSTERVVLVAGPDLPHAAEEVDALAARYPSAQRLGDGSAAAGDVLAALDGADLAHVAAHGVFRADNPLFSSLHLDDGPLTVYDLERLQQAPRLLVLSACDSGLSAVRPGDELMGLSAALFSLGTSSLVASVVPVPDETTRPLMLAFHAAIRRGQPPAAALASARTVSADDDPAALVAAAGFVCFGDG